MSKILSCGAGGSTNAEAVEQINTNTTKSIFPASTMTDLLAVDKSIYKSVNVKGYHAENDGGGDIFNWDSSVDKSTANAGTIIDPDQTLANQGNGSGLGCWARQYVGAIHSKWYAIKGDGSDEVSELTSFFAAKGELILNKGTYGITTPLSLLSDTNLTFEEGAEIKALVADIPHILGISSAAENIIVTNPVVDGNGLRGMNGFGFSSNTTNIKNIALNNPIARNCKRSATTGGGRGFAIQDGVESLTINSPKVYDCTTGYDSNGNTTTIEPVLGILITNAYGENLDELVSVFSDGVNNNTTVPPTQANTIQFLITNIFGRNVGRSLDTTLYSGSGTAGDKDGGVVVSRRGRNLRIKQMSIYNDNTYTIGSVFRGTGNNISIDDFEMWGNCDALAIIGSADNLLPLPNTNDSSYLLAMNGTHHGTSSNIIDVRASAVSTILTSSEFNIKVDQFGDTNNILKTIGAFTDDSLLSIAHILTGRKIYGSLLDVFTFKNTLVSATKEFSLASNIEVDGDILLSTTGRIDFTTAFASAGALVGYVNVKVGGVTMKIPYYAVS